MEIIENGTVTSPAGFQAGGKVAGIKVSGAPDLGILFSDDVATVAGVFTKHTLPSPSVLVDRERVAAGQAHAIVVNSGNANAATGTQGRRDAEENARILARRFGFPAEQALVCSTGVIGVPLPMDRFRQGIPAVQISHQGGGAFARSIMTTDTRPKEIAVRAEIDGRTITIGGCAKGAGMIHPNMATMLAFVTTDAPVERDWLQAALRRAVDRSFNAIDIDGDMSTNDSVIVLANGRAGGPVIAGGASGEAFEAMLTAVCQHLAIAIVRDAEGGTILIEVRVESAATEADAQRLARRIAASLMVKTAVHGYDPNWGRIIAAAGDAGVALVQDTMTIKVGEVTVFEGRPVPYDRDAAVAHLHNDTVILTVGVGQGTASGKAWGCNLSEEYVTLNSVYTT